MARPGIIAHAGEQTFPVTGSRALPVFYDPAGVCAAVVNTLSKAMDAKVVKVLVVVGARDGRVSERAYHERERRAEKGGAHKPTHTYMTNKTGRRAGNHYGDSFRVFGLVSVLMRFVSVRVMPIAGPH
jgi:hypothetical protein